MANPEPTPAPVCTPEPTPAPVCAPAPAPAPVCAPAPTPAPPAAPTPSPDQSLVCAAADPATQSIPADADGVCTPCGNASPAPAPAPTPAPLMAHIEVHVQDCSGAPLKGIDVNVGGQGWSGVTDANGNFDFGDVPPGSYTVLGVLDANSTQASQTLDAPAGKITWFKLVLCAIKVEIQINNTGATNDDIVQVKCDHPEHRHKVPCQIRMTSAAAHDHQITLGNPDGRLRFPEVEDTTRDLTLSRNGAWSDFEISGESGSAAKGDAVIEARLAATCPDGGASAVGDLKGSKPATVFWFDQAEIKITAGGNYTLHGGEFTVVGGTAVNFSAKARIRPAGVDCAAPQVVNLRVGIVQNGEAGVFGRTTWDTPTIAWNPWVAVGTTTEPVPQTWRLTGNQPNAACDTSAPAAPLYDKPGVADTLDANSLQKPAGCAGGGANATSYDIPSNPAPATHDEPALTPAGVKVGKITYTRLVSVTVEGSFTTWAVIFNTATNQVCALRESTWSVNVDSSGFWHQKASPAAADSAPTKDPILTPPFANDIVAKPANTTGAAVGAATTTFTKQ